MSSIRVHQASFSAGEITPELLGRTDDVKYVQGLATCQNFICTPQGPVENRPGTEFVRATKYADKPCRLVSFNRGPTESMCLEFGEKYIRFHTQGMTLLSSNGSPYEVATPYLADDLADLTFSQSIDVVTICHPRHPPQDLKRYGASDWRLSAVKLNNSMAAPTNVKATFNCMDEEGNIKNKTAFTLSYVVTACDAKGEEESEASAVASVQGNLYINSAYARISWNAVSGASVYKVYKSVGGLYGFIGQTEGTSIDDDNISPDMSITPKRHDDAFGLTKAITSVSIKSQGSGYYGTRGILSVQTSGWTNYGEEGNYGEGGNTTLPREFSTYRKNVGIVEVVDEGGSGYGAVIEPIFKDPIGYGINYVTGYKIINPGKNYTKPKIRHLRNNSGTLVVMFEAYCTVDNNTGVSLYVTDSTGSGAVLKPTIVDGKITAVTIVSGGQNYSNPTVHVQANNGSGAQITVSTGSGSSYPISATRYEQRRIFAGSYQWPGHIWMTRNGTEDDMSYRLPVQDDDRISVDMATTDGGSIRHIIATTQLLILTDGGEYRVTPINSDAITPTSMNIRPQSFVGASRVQPVLVNNTVLYPAARGGHIRELGYNYQAGGYVTGDICLRATHLFDHKTIVSLAYQKAPYPVVWAVSSSGDLLGATYVPEQAVLGWHRHTTTLGAFESVCTVSEGDVDHVYVVVRRLVQGLYYRFVERMKDRSFPTLEDSFLVDSGVTVDTRGSETYFTEVSGLAHLEGCTVSILADGAVFAQQKVTNGKVVLDRKVQIAHVGLPIRAELMTLPVRIPTQDGTMGRGRKKSVNVVWLRVLNTSGVWAGPKDGELVENKNRTTEPPGSPPSLKNTELEIRIPRSIDTEGQVRISQDDPLPLTLLASTAEVDLMS